MNIVLILLATAVAGLLIEGAVILRLRQKLARSREHNKQIIVMTARRDFDEGRLMLDEGFTDQLRRDLQGVDGGSYA